MAKTVVEFMLSEKGKLEAQKDSKTSNLEETDGDAGMAREQSYLVTSDLNSELKEGKNCRGFNDSLKTVFVRHKRYETPAVSRGCNPKEGLINYR